MSVLGWRHARWLVGAAVLGAVLWHTGTGPFVAGVRSIDGGTLALGAAIAVPITAACAWRWHLVARGLGVQVPMGRALASCYRAQFLNTTLPGGVVGDVHRGVRHGRDVGDTALGLRAVWWERFAGQVVQAVLTVTVVLVLLPSPARGGVLVAFGVLASVVAAAALVASAARHHALSTRVLRAARADVRQGLLERRAWPGVVLASAAVVGGHVATYLLAARATGVTASTTTLVPVTLLVLVAAGLPVNLAGWGPREGMAAWSFGLAGLGAGQGVATAVAYGAIVLVANLPGAVVLAIGAVRRRHVGGTRPRLDLQPGVVEQGGRHA